MISHSMKGMFVEWTIVILIIIEVVLMTIDLLK
ncbi:MAG: RMD1 family protein, partial [Vallitaleaceae bacterium]|nr:RMD1 family protein [Vallitaleaceae bacterium]